MKKHEPKPLPKFPETDPAGMFCFFSRGTSIASKLIMRVLDFPWSHCGLGFVWDDGQEWIFEALFGRGVEVPSPLSHLKAWSEEKDGRAYVVIPLMFHRKVVSNKLKVAQTYVGAAGYSETQLLWMYAFERWGWRVPASMGNVVCSEFLARVLYPDLDIRGNRTFDEVTPKSAWMRLQ